MRRRLLELASTAALLVTFAGAGTGFYAWFERRRRLNDTLRAALDEDALLQFASSDNAARLMSLVEQGADIHLRGPEGRTALMMVARFGTVDQVRELIDRRADPRVADEHGMTPVIWATWSQDSPAIIDALVAAGSSVHAADRQGLTPLIWAVRNGNVGAVSTLGKAELGPGKREALRLVREHGGVE
jgi:uncharacterized protein